MIKILDFNNCQTNLRLYGGMAGDKLGIIYNNENWFLKFPKSTKGMKRVDISYTTSPLSEFIGSHIYEILGYDAHKTLLGIKDDILVVACRDFLKNGEVLLEYRQLQNFYNKELRILLEDSFSSSDTERHGTNLNTLLIHLDNNPIIKSIPNCKTRLFECMIIDCFINNNDRNSGNWGVILNELDNKYRNSPIFDNGGSFSNKLSDKQIYSILTSEDKMNQSSLYSSSGYYYDDKQLSFRELIELDNKDLNGAIMKIVPVIAKSFTEIDELIYSIPENYKDIGIMSPIRKEFYIKGMEIRFNKLLLNRYLELCKEYDIEINHSIKEYLDNKDFIMSSDEVVNDLIL